MTRTRWRKILADFTQRRARTLLTLFGLTLGLVFVGSVVTACVIMRNDLDANFRLTNPANVTLTAAAIPAPLMASVGAVSGVTGIEERPEFGALLQTGPDRWMPLRIAVVRDFEHLRIARFTRQDGQWPPPPGGLLIERDGRWLFDGPPADSLAIRLPNGATVRSAFSGYVFDAGQHPSRMERVLYGYVTPETLARWSLPLGSTRLLITTTPASAVAAGMRIETLFQEAGVALKRLDVHPRPVHGHQFQFDTIRGLLAGLASVALILCAILIVNLIDSLMAVEQQTIGILRALGARSGQIVQDYALGMGVLGLLAGALSLYPSLWTGRMIARFIAMGLNFEVLSRSGPLWLTPLLLCIGVVVPVAVALSAIIRAATQPVRQALIRGDGGRAVPFADGFGAFMTFLPLIPRLAVRSVARKPRKALLSALMLSLGLAFFVTALTIRASMLSTVESVRRTTSFDVAVELHESEPVEALAAWMDEISGVRHREYWWTGEAALVPPGSGFHNPKPVIGIADPTESLRPDVSAGHWIDAGFPAGIVVNQQLLREDPDVHLGGTYPMIVDRQRIDVTVTGVIQEFAPGRIYCAKALVDRWLHQEGRANTLVLTLEDDTVETLRLTTRHIEDSATGPDRQISAMLLNRSLEKVIEGHLAILTGLLMLIAAMTLLVGALGLASSISISVIERYREIAVLKALGARGSSIGALFVTEGVVIAIVGWAMAVAWTPLLSRPVVAALGSAVIGYQFDYRTSPGGILLALAVALAVALAATLLPIRAALRLAVLRRLRFA